MGLSYMTRTGWDQWIKDYWHLCTVWKMCSAIMLSLYPVIHIHDPQQTLLFLLFRCVLNRYYRVPYHIFVICHSSFMEFFNIDVRPNNVFFAWHLSAVRCLLLLLWERLLLFYCCVALWWTKFQIKIVLVRCRRWLEKKHNRNFLFTHGNDRVYLEMHKRTVWATDDGGLSIEILDCNTNLSLISSNLYNHCVSIEFRWSIFTFQYNMLC